jgi:hypothetical protein
MRSVNYMQLGTGRLFMCNCRDCIDALLKESFTARVVSSAGWQCLYTPEYFDGGEVDLFMNQV